MWMTELRFRKADRGYIFFPYGAFGSGYKVSEEKKAELTIFLNRENLIFATLIVLALLSIAAIWIDLPSYWPDLLFAFSLVFAVYSHFRLRRHLGDAERSTVRRTFKEFRIERSRLVPRSTAYVFLVATICMTAFGVLAIYNFCQDGYKLGVWGGVIWTAGSIVALIVTIDAIRLQRVLS